MNIITINHEPVELYKILKFECLVDGGGEAKAVITHGYVAVNGEQTLQKRRKIYSGDVIEFNGEIYQIALDSHNTPAQDTAQHGSGETKAQSKQTSYNQNSSQNSGTAQPAPAKPRKRSAIKF